MVLVDSSVWIDFSRGLDCAQTRRLDELLRRHQLLTGDLILAQVLQGFRDDLKFRRARRWLGRLAYADLAGREIALQARAQLPPPSLPGRHRAQDDRCTHRHLLHPQRPQPVVHRPRLRPDGGTSRVAGRMNREGTQQVSPAVGLGGDG